MFGNTGKILRIDLLSKEYDILEPSLEEYVRFVGGRGLAVKLLYEIAGRGVDPLSPGNPLIFMAGPLTGSAIPYTSRIAVVTKSPQTGFYNRSMAGGRFPAWLKQAGYDGIILTGASDSWIYLHVSEEGCELREANWLKGLSTGETVKALRERHGQAVSVACIGQAGENLVSYANIRFDMHNFAGRAGAGCVMGSKKVKAIIVEKGEGAYRPKDEEAVREIAMELNSRIREAGMESFRKYGTAQTLLLTNELGVLPTRNFQTGVYEHAESLSHITLYEHYSFSSSCYACPVGCKKAYKFEKIIYGPEYESLAMLGPNLGMKDVSQVATLNDLCNEYGMDTISTGGTLALVMEYCQRNPEKAPVKLSFGDFESAKKAIDDIAYRRGFGKEMARGASYLSTILPKSKGYAAHVKGLEMPAYDPRGLQGFGLAYAISPRGACHNTYSMYRAEVSPGRETDRFSSEGKAKVIRRWAVNYAIYEMLVFCSFGRGLVDRNFLASALKHATGIDYTVEDLVNAAMRVITLERLYNIREGLKPWMDTLPSRFLEEPMPEGSARGMTVKLWDMLREAYSEFGWDENGIPKEETLNTLGLSEYRPTYHSLS